MPPAARGGRAGPRVEVPAGRGPDERVNYRLSVRDLAHWLFRSGDLYSRYDGTATADEGVATQKKLQKGKGAGYQPEVTVRYSESRDGVALVVAGRADGFLADPALAQVDEFKCCRAPAAQVHGLLGDVHWAQVRLYAALLAIEHSEIESWTTNLIYAHPDTLVAERHSETVSADALRHFLSATLDRLFALLRAQSMHLRARATFAEQLAFPLAAFRTGQRVAARRVYRALRDNEQFLLEAPTGSGKTLTTLFPAVKLLSDEAARVFYLTARNTGQAAAVRAGRQLADDAAALRIITITAKEKCCPIAGMPCDPERCDRAHGYFDRVDAATSALLSHTHVDAATVAAVADTHTVCPFELSLDAARWADVVICDYNYFFDPMVRLRRFAHLPSARLLIDEAHQMTPRVTGMLTAEIGRTELKAARAEPLPDGLERRVAAVDRALLRVRRPFADQPEGIYACDYPTTLLRALQRLCDEASATEIALDAFPAFRAAYFTALRLLKIAELADSACLAGFVVLDRYDDGIRLASLDPAAYTRSILGQYGGHVRFSASLSPMALLQRLHGIDQGTEARSEGGYSADQLDVRIVPDIATYYRQREASVAPLAALTTALIERHGGCFFVAFPSFDYLDLFWAGAAHGEHVVVRRQTRGMDDAARDRFLRDIETEPGPQLVCIVLGGVFSESIELLGRRLTGLVVVGIGYPPRTAHTLAVQQHFDTAGIDGHCVAFEQPAMVKVVQAAGRILRSPEDRGVLCLVDPRFLEPRYQQFFPRFWRPATTPLRRLIDECRSADPDATDSAKQNAGCGEHEESAEDTP